MIRKLLTPLKYTKVISTNMYDSPNMYDSTNRHDSTYYDQYYRGLLTITNNILPL